MYTGEYLINPAEEKKNKRISAIITAILVALLIIISIFIILNQKEPEFPQEGILISWGDPNDQGFGEIEPTKSEAPAQSNPSTPQPVEEVQEVTPTNNVNAVEVETKVEKKPVEPTKTPVKTPEPKPQEQKVEEKPKIDQTKLFKGGNTSDNNATSQGKTYGGMGNEGDPTGGTRPGMSTGDGAFELGGNLKGRGWRIQPNEDRINHNLSATETLILNIEVDPEGNVKVLGLGRGNEVTDPNIQRMVIREVENARTKPGNSTVRGTVTFVLKPR